MAKKSALNLPLLLALSLLVAAANGFSATFSGNADLTVSDPNGSLSWSNSVNALTVQCWFEISIPSGTNLTQNMAILVNQTSGSDGSGNPGAFLFRYNIYNGCVEFVTQGSSGGYTNTLIQQPYLQRWYHLAVVRQGSVFTGYVDGLQAFPPSAANVGNSGATAGISIGGWGQSDYLYGEVQEVSIYQSALAQDFIAQYMYNSQPTNDPTLGLTGYYPIGFSTNAASSLANLAPGSSASPASIQGSGTVTFPLTDEAGEQSAFDAWRNGGRNAIVPLSGAFTWQQSILSRPTPGIAFDLRMEYSSANSSSGALLGSTSPYAQGVLGSGWQHSFQTALIPSFDFAPLGTVDTVGLMQCGGSIETWDIDYATGQYLTRDGEYNGELDQGVTNWTWTTPDRLVYSFYPPDSGPNFVMYGRLISIRDFNGNSVQLNWDQTTGVLTQIVDSVGGTYNFNYHAGLLTNITFNSWSVNFAYNSTNQLISKTITNNSGLYSGVNTTWQFAYGTNGLLSQIIDPRGNTSVAVQYDQYGRMTNQIDALGRATATLYDMPTNFQLTHIDPASNSWVEGYDRKGNILSQTDPLTNTTSYTYDTNDNRLSITEPLGYTTYFGYDSRANVIARTNALTNITLWTFDSFFNKPIQQVDALGWTNFYVLNQTNGNLLRHYDAIGSLVTYLYSSNGLVLSSTDANGNVTQFGYDINGFLISTTDPTTNTTTYGNNDVGWKLAATNALGQVTTHAFDLNGNVVLTVDPLNRSFTKTYDANGNLLSASDAKGRLTTFAYDAANQKTNMADRTGTNTWEYYYTPRGKLDHVTDPLGNSTVNTYDTANRLVSVTDPLGNSITNFYDQNGNITNMTDQLGRPWSKTFDQLDRVVAATDPLGNTTQTSYDQDGRVSQVTTPNGYPTAHYYDGRGRLTKWVDAQNFPWQYAYDGVGNITNITDALAGHYIMGYGSRNERLFEQNQNSNVWRYAYDALLRVESKTDPKGTTRTMTYDLGSRVIEVDYNTPRVDTFVYDDNNNPIILTRSGSGPSTAGDLTYDVMDRIVGDTDAFGKTVGYGYDPLGRRKTLTYPDGKMLTNNYDALNHLTNQVDWAGRQLDYTYDKLGRLLTRSYPNTIVQSNAYDNAGRITSLSYSPQTVPNAQPINVYIALTYAYDRNGNRTGATEQGTLAWPMPALHIESTAYTPAGKLIGKTDAFSSSNNFTYQYDASGNMTNAASPAQSYALSYDEDNRTTSIHWTAGVSSNTIISNRYDALGRRIAKTVSGIETDYVLDLGGSMERILCDTSANGQITAWYVHGPDLCYKVNATNGLTCYHADGAGNILALTDQNTNVVAEYAYTPYGRSLDSTNSASQTFNPYQFVGSQGVMQDLPNLYFMRARYYSADASSFLSTDPVKHIGPRWCPVAYAYAGNSPINLRDPSGLSYNDLQLWGAFGLGIYVDIQWSSFVSPVVKIGVGAGLGGGGAYTYSSGTPSESQQSRSLIGVANAGPIGSQAELAWQQGQAALSSGLESVSAQLGEGPYSLGGTLSQAPSDNLVGSLQGSYGGGLGGGLFYVQPATGEAGTGTAMTSHTITANTTGVALNIAQVNPPASASSNAGSTSSSGSQPSGTSHNTQQNGSSGPSGITQNVPATASAALSGWANTGWGATGWANLPGATPPGHPIGSP